MSLRETPSPNFDSRDGQEVDMLVLHYTGMRSMAAALDKLRDPAAKVSAHYLVDEDGGIYRLVDEAQRAWHAGVSSWRGNTNINQRSVGIEIVNPGHEYGYRPFPKAQMESVAELCKGILARHNIPARNVVGHSDVAPARKDDPGELFDWQWLARQGVGLWPIEVTGSRKQETDKQILLPAACDLLSFGYHTADLPKTITAFQRHFRPKLLTGKWDEECALILNSLLDSTR
jgi:N-acetylmuramoyl-L-alanine amidase